mgnify:CR=1 FL=1|tara:strand:+ start:15140 stop:15832 length:693 start_codon:yes stop_codon:yes gene_type:complete
MENIRISDALQVLRPGAEWSITNNSYGQLDWLDTEQTKPTEEEVAQKVAELTYQKEVEAYKEQRAAEYPSYADQFDKIYHSGVNAWKAQIKTIKDKYPKQTIDATELQARKDQAVSDIQTERYATALKRLDQYVLSVGRPEITEEVEVVTGKTWVGDETGSWVENTTTETVVVYNAIDPLPATVEVFNQETESMETVPNPLIVKDEEERAAAQAVVDATPQQVKDDYASA